MEIRTYRIALPVLAALALGCAGKTHYGVPQLTGANPTQAVVGTSVDISGASLEGTSSVSFGGAPAQSFQVHGGNVITATVPVDASTGSITVQNPAGVRTSTFVFTVVPQIATVSPNPIPSAEVAATTLSITGSGLASTTAVSIGGVAIDPANITIYDANTVNVLLSGASIGTGALPVTLTASGIVTPAGLTLTVTP
jgi:hypothetical protein